MVLFSPSVEPFGESYLLHLLNRPACSMKTSIRPIYVVSNTVIRLPFGVVLIEPRFDLELKLDQLVDRGQRPLASSRPSLLFSHRITLFTWPWFIQFNL